MTIFSQSAERKLDKQMYILIYYALTAIYIYELLYLETYFSTTPSEGSDDVLWATLWNELNFKEFTRCILI